MSNSKKKLLIADDEPNIRALVKKTFKNEYTVIEAKNGKEAIEYAGRNIPDIILLDVMMPDTDGLTALTTLKSDKRTLDIPVIMLTGVAHDMNEKLASSLGAHSYLIKPVAPRDLIDIVKKAI